MEIVIVICLLIVIVLLLQDKIVIKKRTKQVPPQKKVNPNLPDIMGQPKPVERLSVPNTANERQIEEPEINPANLDIEYDENENVGIQIPQEELDEVFSNMPDFEEEEEELRELISQKNYFGVEEMVEGMHLNDTLKKLFSLLGSFETQVEELAEAKSLASDYPNILSAITDLEKLGSFLRLYGIEKYVSFELGIISNYHYVPILFFIESATFFRL